MSTQKNHNWVKIYSTRSLQKANIVKSLLSAEDVNCVIVNKQDSMQVFLHNAMIELHVLQDDLLKAKHILSKIDIDE